MKLSLPTTITALHLSFGPYAVTGSSGKTKWRNNNLNFSQNNVFILCHQCYFSCFKVSCDPHLGEKGSEERDYSELQSLLH